MSWKSFACLAALSAMVAPAAAQPSIAWVDNTGSATLQVTTADGGALAAEILIDSAAMISNPVINAAVWDTPNPGNNSITGGETTGLYDTDIASGDLFLSFGSIVVTAGTYDLLTIDYSGSGDIVGSGLVAQLGVNTTGLTDTLTVTDGPSLPGDVNNDGSVDLADFNLVANNLGATAPPSPVPGDANGDDSVDLADFNLVANNLGATAPASAVPEPTAMVAALAALACVGFGRRND